MGTNVATAPVQPLRALERANQVRLARAELKREIAAGLRSAAEVVLECPWEARSMTVSELLMSQRRWGRARCRRLLLAIGLAENKVIGTLTPRQRRLLAGVLHRPVAGVSEEIVRGTAQPAPI
jgi:hypothetical protein